LKPCGGLGDRLGQRSAMVGTPHGAASSSKRPRLQLLRLELAREDAEERQRSA
jgi:hypothetical protein